MTITELIMLLLVYAAAVSTSLYHGWAAEKIVRLGQSATNANRNYHDWANLSGGILGLTCLVVFSIGDNHKLPVRIQLAELFLQLIIVFSFYPLGKLGGRWWLKRKVPARY